MHSAPFRCLTKLGAKRAEPVQKFVPRCCVGIFRNERTRSTSLDPKLKFWCVSYYLGAFGTVWSPYETRCKTGRTSAKVRATQSRRNFSQRTHPIHPLDTKLTFCCVSYYLGAFGTVWLPYEPRWKTSRTSAKLRAPKSRQNFSQRTHLIHPIVPKLTFWCVWYYLGAFVTVWLPYETRCKTGRTSAKLRATKSRQNFSQRTHPIRPHLNLN